MLSDGKKLPVFITTIAGRDNCVTGNLCRTPWCPSLACKSGYECPRKKEDSNTIDLRTFHRTNAYHQRQMNLRDRPIYGIGDYVHVKGEQGKNLYLGGMEWGKTFISSPVQRSLTCISQVEIFPVNLVSSSTVLICFMNFIVLCLPKVKAGWDSMKVLQRCIWHADQLCDPNPFVSFWRLIRQGFTDSILAFKCFSGITKIGDCIWKSWFIHFLARTCIQFALRSLKCEICLRSVLYYSVSQIYPVMVSPYVSDKGKTLSCIPAFSFVNILC